MTTFVQGHGAGANQLPASLGQHVSAASLSVVIASDYTLPVTISTTPSAPMYVELTDGTTAFKGVAASQLPSALGSQVKASSLSVTLASDQGNLAVSVQNATLAVTQSGTWNIGGIPTTLGQKTMAGSSGVVIASDQSSIPVTVGNATLAVTQSGTWAVTGLPTGLGQKLSAASTSVVVASDSTIAAVQSGTWAVTSTQLPGTLGQKTMVNSTGVVIASDQSSIPVTGTFWQATQPVSAASLPLPTGAATSALQTTGNTSLGSIDTKTPSLGQAAMASSVPVTIASNQGAIGSVTQTGIDYNTGLAGATTQRVTEAGRAKAWLARNDYTSTNVTTGAYVQLVASTGAATTRLRIFDSSGSAMILATGAALSEVDQLYIPPGGFDSPVELNIAAGVRVSLKALDTAASVGQAVVTAFS